MTSRSRGPRNDLRILAAGRDRRLRPYGVFPRESSQRKGAPRHRRGLERSCPLEVVEFEIVSTPPRWASARKTAVGRPSVFSCCFPHGHRRRFGVDRRGRETVARLRARQILLLGAPPHGASRSVVLERPVWGGEELDFLRNRTLVRVASFVTAYVAVQVLATGVLVVSGFSITESLFEHGSVLGTVGRLVGVTRKLPQASSGRRSPECFWGGSRSSSCCSRFGRASSGAGSLAPADSLKTRKAMFSTSSWCSTAHDVLGSRVTADVLVTLSRPATRNPSHDVLRLARRTLFWTGPRKERIYDGFESVRPSPAIWR